MDIKDIQELLKFINRSTLTDVEIEQKDFRLRVQRKPEGVVYAQVPVAQPVAQPVVHAAPVVQAAPVETPKAEAPASAPKAEAGSASGKKLHEFKAPFIGTFYRATGPDKEPFAKVGDHITWAEAATVNTRRAAPTATEAAEP